MDLTLQEAAALLLARRHITILSHRKPDGDTLGGAFALCWALEGLGKAARVLCADGYPDRYCFLYPDGYTPPVFAPDEEDFVVAVDTASLELLGTLGDRYKDKIDLIIDHHGSNTRFAPNTIVDTAAGATAELIFQLIPLLGAGYTPAIAGALYTGVATDTGCFRYTNTTAQTLRIAASLIDAGADSILINRLMFETKSKGRLAVEAMAMGSVEYDYDGRCAIIYITEAMLAATGVSEYDIEGISAMPRQIEGVEAGVTIREQGGECRISLRTCSMVDASAVCQQLGGGGHPRAAGCTVKGDVLTARQAMLKALKPFLEGEAQ